MLIRPFSKLLHCKRGITASRNVHRKVALTAEAYDVKRGLYNCLEESDLKHFRQMLPDRVVTDENELEPYNTDWLETVRGQSKVVLKPKTTEEVSNILKYCNERKLAVCPQGGNTGLVGGSVPVFDEVILSMKLMDNILDLDPIAGNMVCQAGCILEKLNLALESHNLIMPLDLGAKGSCHIGGNISTNAGGIRYLRYGSLRGSVVGLEAVLADGTVMDCMSTVRKDNTGYDMKQLFIGSEGTLGVVTAVSILTPVKPTSVNVAFFGVDSYNDLLSVMVMARKSLGEIVSAIEFLDAACMQEACAQLQLTNPILEHPFYFLVETSGCDASHDEEKLTAFAEKVLESNLAKDGTLATDLTKIQSIWALRENLAEALKRRGYTYKYDISLPTEKMYDIVEMMREKMKGVCTVYGYGHLGDGNLHLNLVTPEYDPNVASIISPLIFEWTASVKGSISAEHGLGFSKKNYIGMSKSAEAVNTMKIMKVMLDPNLILNPYKTLPLESQR